MSCFHPITIPNPKLVKNNVFDKKVIEVPCGHCPSCKENRRASWFVRLYYEWKYCDDNNGFSLYETLTYNNEHLPHFIEYMSNGKLVKEFPCFSVRDIQLYLKKIRKRLKYFGYDFSFKYWLSMEFGGRTHRPHYHILFFVPTHCISPWFFKKIVEECWIENGFVKAGKLNNGFIVGSGALNYCAKYVCKDVYEDCYFRQQEKRLLKLGIPEESIKAHLPHTMQSNHIGIYALQMDDLNDLDNFLKGDIYIPDNDKEVKQYKLPLYYERKIFYDVRYRYFDSDSNSYISVPRLSEIPVGCEYSPIYVLNDLGMEMKESRAQKALDSVTNVYRVVLSLPDALSYVEKLNKKFKTSFESVKSFQQYIKKNLPEEVFVSYSLVYRGCINSSNCNCVASPCGSTPYYDYMLMHDMSRGVRPLSVDFNNLCVNIDYFNSMPFIEDNYQMIRYLFYLVHLDLEEQIKNEEMNYVNQKTAYLQSIV